jgi:hypothetical protein
MNHFSKFILHMSITPRYSSKIVTRAFFSQLPPHMSAFITFPQPPTTLVPQPKQTKSIPTTTLQNLKIITASQVSRHHSIQTSPITTKTNDSKITSPSPTPKMSAQDHPTTFTSTVVPDLEKQKPRPRTPYHQYLTNPSYKLVLLASPSPSSSPASSS